MPGGMSMPDETTVANGWDPDQYSRFAAERAKPFLDLLAMVEPLPGGEVIDLGCGTGELTAELHAHTQAGTTTGIDASEAMLARALPLAGNGLRACRVFVAQSPRRVGYPGPHTALAVVNER